MSDSTTTTTNKSLSDERDNTNIHVSAKGKSKAAIGVDDLVAEGIERKYAEDWLIVRKAKRATLTPTAWDAVKAEAEKAGITPGDAVRICAANSWQGFKATWYAKLLQEGQGHAQRGKAVGTHGGYEGRNYGTGGAL